LAFTFLCAPATSWAASVTLRWQANSEPDIASYNLYYGTQSREYGLPIPVGDVTSYTVDSLTEGRTYYFSVTAVDTSGNESGYSYEVSANATSSEPATEDYQLLLSTRSDRSNAVKLSGQTISGDVYVFLDPEAYVSQVVFSIDGTYHNTENYAPYDLGVPFDTITLSNGTHTISARITDQGGSVQTISGTCSVFNAEDSTSSSTAVIPLPAAANYGKIKEGDQNHVNNVTYSFNGISGGVILSYRVWDIDFNDEVQVVLNGSPVGFVPTTSNERWSGVLTLYLQDDQVNDSSSNTLVFNNTYNPPNEYWWGVGSVSVATDTPIALPSSAPYGMIKGGDQSHADQVRYSFAGMSGDVKLNYRAFDIDATKNPEVQVIVNGEVVANLPVTGNDQWSEDRAIIIPDNLVNNTSVNLLVFNATYNPPNSYWWGVSNVSVAQDLPIALPSADNYGMIKDGDQTHVNKVTYSFGGKVGNVTLNYQAWDVDFADEVQIVLNGTPVGYAKETKNNRWSGDLSINLPDSLVNNTGQNIVEFNNTYNPPNTYWWGVGNVSVD